MSRNHPLNKKRNTSPYKHAYKEISSALQTLTILEGSLPFFSLKWTIYLLQLYGYLVVWGPVVWIFGIPENERDMKLGDTPIRITNHPGPKTTDLRFVSPSDWELNILAKKYVTPWVHGSSIRDKMVAPKLCATTNHPNSPKKPNKTYKKVTSS